MLAHLVHHAATYSAPSTAIGWLRRAPWARACHAAQSAPNHPLLPAILAAGRRGRWRAALELLEQCELDAAKSAIPVTAYRSALLACRKHGRLAEAVDVLERMGDDLRDTHAYNEVLHLLRLRGDLDEAERFWRQMEGRAERDALSYYHLLHMCGELGNWQRALALLDEAVSTLPGGEADLHGGHYLAAMRACVRDRRWREALRVCRRVPPAVLSSDIWLCKVALQACAEAGEPALAASLVAAMDGKATDEQRSQWLVACRRARSVGGAREVWAAIEAAASSAGTAPSGLGFALMIGTLFDAADDCSAAATAPPTDVESGKAFAAEATELAARAARELKAEDSHVALTAALGCAIKGGRVAAAREALRLIDGAAAGSIDVGAQLKVLDLCASTGEWQALVEEAADTRDRGGLRWPAADAERLQETLDATCVHVAAEVERTERSEAGKEDDDASAAALMRDGLSALRELSSAAGVDERTGAAPSADAAAASAAARKHSARSYSRSIALEGEDGWPLDVVYEDDDLIAVSKPVGVSVHPRHRFEASSVVNRVIAHMDGRTPYVLHRLDQPTSGVLLFAKTVVAARGIQQQFRERDAQKEYLAVLRGRPAEDTFECDEPIAGDPNDKTLSVVVPRRLQVAPGAASTRAGRRTRASRCSRATATRRPAASVPSRAACIRSACTPNTSATRWRAIRSTALTGRAPPKARGCSYTRTACA